VLQLLDSSCFYTRKQDGSRQLSRKGKDGIFPMEGEVRVCSPDMQLENFKAIKPLLDLFEKRKVLVVTPMPRYTYSGGLLQQHGPLHQHEGPQLQMPDAAGPGVDQEEPEGLRFPQWYAQRESGRSQNRHQRTF
jgi:hypothetical protein